jgi:hypothetical protein
MDKFVDSAAPYASLIGRLLIASIFITSAASRLDSGLWGCIPHRSFGGVAMLELQ